MTSHQNPDLTYINKKEYRKFCQKEKNIPIFSQDWWLDAVCGEQNWDVVIARKNNQIVATLPYYLQNKFYYRIINMPLFTQTMGPYLKYPQNLNEYKKLSFEKEIMVQLIDQLPQFDLFVQNFHHSITNWLPFYWAHFSQTTRYTYIIEELSDINDIYANLYSSTKRHINNAKMILRIKENCDLELVYRINKNTLQKSQCSLDYSFDLLKRIDDSCIKNNCRKIIYAEDENHNVHAVIYLVWDNNNIYDLIGGSLPEFKSSGAKNLLVWEAIQFAAKIKKTFDFEGSMIEGVERFIRGFGAKQIPYFLIYKDTRNIFQKGITYINNSIHRLL